MRVNNCSYALQCTPLHNILIFVFVRYVYRISRNFLLVLALVSVALSSSTTSALREQQQHPAIRTGHRSGFRRSSWVVAAANDHDDATFQGHDDTSRAIHGKLNA